LSPPVQFYRLSRWVIVAVLIQTGFKPNGKVTCAEPVNLTIAGVGYTATQRLPQEGLEEFSCKTGIQFDLNTAWGNSKDKQALILRAFYVI
jgi:hypothetical protein